MFVFSSFILKKRLIWVKCPTTLCFTKKKSLFLLWYKRKVFSFQLCVLLQHLVYPDRKALGYCICKSDTITQIYRPVSLDNICHFCSCISICIFCISSLVNFKYNILPGIDFVGRRTHPLRFRSRPDQDFLINHSNFVSFDWNFKTHKICLTLVKQILSFNSKKVLFTLVPKKSVV